MKAERRHDLETNSLALWLRFRAPELAQKHGAKILLGIIILVLAVVLIRQRMEAPKRAANSAAAYLASAREQIDEMNPGLRTPRVPGQSKVILDQIKSALERSDDPVIQAEANVTTGDYYWALYRWPEFPEATTRPELRPSDPKEELLKRAEEAYRRALAIPSVKPHLAAAARFGLAAIAESRAQIEQNPFNAQLRRQLLYIYQEKRRTLEQIQDHDDTTL